MVLLATNEPERLDPAFDRRFLTKISMPVPAPTERIAILHRELRRQAIPGFDDLVMNPETSRLAESLELTGGYWLNVVESAHLLALTEGKQKTSIEHLTEAAHRQVKQLVMHQNDERREHAFTLTWNGIDKKLPMATAGQPTPHRPANR